MRTSGIFRLHDSISFSLTFVLFSESVDPEAEAVVEAEPGVLPDDDVAGADYPVRLLPDHSGLAWKKVLFRMHQFKFRGKRSAQIIS